MTTRQAAVIKDVLENKTPVSVSMRNNGYTPQQAKKLAIKKSDAWREVMQQFLPDHKLFAKHEKLLDAKRIHGTGDDFIEVDDAPTQLKALELSYHLKGYGVDNGRQTLNQVNISWDSNGYMPPNNIQNAKPTYTPKNKSTK